MHRRRLLLAVVLAAASLAVPATWGGAASAGRSSWHLARVIGPDDAGEMTGVDCVSASHCIATKFGGYIFSTSNAWSTFHRVQGKGTHVADNMNAVGCLTSTTCVAFGGWWPNSTDYGLLFRTSDGGATWVPEHPSTTSTRWSVWSVSCPSSTVCYAAGDRNGHTAYWMKSTNSGVTWDTHVGIDPSIGVLDGISCDSSSFCVVVGSTSAVTHTGGAKWTDGTVPSSVRYLYGISCQLSIDCEAVGSTTSGSVVALRSTDG